MEENQTTNINPKVQSTNTAYAGFWIRYASLYLDALILVIPPLALGVLASSILRQSPVKDFIPIVVYLIIFGLDVFFLEKFGATPGKMFFGLRVVTVNGLNPSFLRAVFRESLGRFLSGIFFIGYLWVAFDKEKQGFHDKIAKTHVIILKSTSTLRKVFVFIIILPAPCLLIFNFALAYYHARTASSTISPPPAFNNIKVKGLQTYTSLNNTWMIQYDPSMVYLFPQQDNFSGAGMLCPIAFQIYSVDNPELAAISLKSYAASNSLYFGKYIGNISLNTVGGIKTERVYSSQNNVATSSSTQNLFNDRKTVYYLLAYKNSMYTLSYDALTNLSRGGNCDRNEQYINSMFKTFKIL